MTLNHKVYLGDGCYAAWDGYHVVLRTEDGFQCTNEIFLEPLVLRAFDEYRETLKLLLAREQK